MAYFDPNDPMLNRIKFKMYLRIHASFFTIVFEVIILVDKKQLLLNLFFLAVSPLRKRLNLTAIRLKHFKVFTTKPVIYPISNGFLNRM